MADAPLIPTLDNSVPSRPPLPIFLRFAPIVSFDHISEQSRTFPQEVKCQSSASPAKCLMD